MTMLEPSRPLPFDLTPHERSGSTWRKLNDYLQAELAYLRSANDNDMGERDRCKLIGRIEHVKLLLDAGK